MISGIRFPSGESAILKITKMLAFDFDATAQTSRLHVVHSSLPFLTPPRSSLIAFIASAQSMSYIIGMSMKRPLIIGIAGGTGSGKTTVTQKILERLDREKVLLLQHDSYYKDIATLGGISPSEINFDHPAALETSLLIKHLELLQAWQSVEQPVYDFVTYHRLTETRRTEPKKVIIVDGILIFESANLRQMMDIKIYVDTDADERLLRRLKRDLLERQRSIESVIAQYTKTVKPMHLEFVEPSKRWADIIIPNGGENKVAIDMVVSKINELLQAERESPVDYL